MCSLLIEWFRVLDSQRCSVPILLLCKLADGSGAVMTTFLDKNDENQAFSISLKANEVDKYDHCKPIYMEDHH